MDDGSFHVRSKGLQERTASGSGRIEICVEAMSPGSRQRLVEHLRRTRSACDADAQPARCRGKAVLSFAPRRDGEAATS